MARATPPSSPEHPAVTAYIDGFPAEVRDRLATLRATIRKAAPSAEERMAYGIPTWWQGEHLIHLGGFKRHVGIYPGPDAIEAFAEALSGYVTSKGAVQIPHDAPLPLALVMKLVRHRLAAVAEKKPAARATPAKQPAARRSAAKKPAERVASAKKPVANRATARPRAADTKASPARSTPRPRAAEAYPQIEVASRAELRGWLEAQHARSRGAWIVTWKKHVPGKHVDAVAVCEEALCFGWIDSLPRALDADRTMLLVTPRKPKSAWSRVNKDRVARLLSEGLLRPAGLAVIEAAKASGTWEALDAVEALELPGDLVTSFASAPSAARTHFDAFPRSAKRGILEWIQNAKKPETRAKRIAETVRLAGKNERALAWRP